MKILSRLKEVGLSLRLQLTVELLYLLVDLSDILFNEFLHVQGSSNVRKTATHALHTAVYKDASQYFSRFFCVKMSVSQIKLTHDYFRLLFSSLNDRDIQFYSNPCEKDTGMEVCFISKDVNILITIVEVAWWKRFQMSGHLNRNIQYQVQSRLLIKATSPSSSPIFKDQQNLINKKQTTKKNNDIHI